MNRRPLTDDEMLDALASARSVCRWESLPAYIEPGEAALVAVWAAGGRGLPSSTRWPDLVAGVVAAGGSFTRVRVQEDPPTRYQRWLQHLAAEWAGPAGEDVRVLSRAVARRIAWLSPGSDWWLIDGRQLILMAFDAEGRHQSNQLVDGGLSVVRARALWDLAVHLSTPVVPRAVLTSHT